MVGWYPGRRRGSWCSFPPLAVSGDGGLHDPVALFHARSPLPKLVRSLKVSSQPPRRDVWCSFLFFFIVVGLIAVVSGPKSPTGAASAEHAEDA